uniref:GATA transcription factor n=1 Tax=Diospyros kaki TaxID=35925 RepID=A0A5P9PAZ0_DIOKA|nr:GATA4 [Diospyros kaki]
MAWMEARALKSSFLSELAAISDEQVLLVDDLGGFDGVACGSSDDCWVDGFLDLSNKDFEEGFVEEEEEESEEDEDEDEGKGSASLSSQYRVDYDENSNSGTGDSGSFHGLPVGDFEDLEWLSQFVDDSGPELSLLCPVGDFKDPAKGNSINRPEPESRPPIQGTPLLCASSPNPAKPRTKRSRPAGSGWTSDSSSTMSSPSRSSSASVSSISNPVQATEPAATDLDLKPPAKRQKKRPSGETVGDAAQRRCTHCQVQKTPQWRRGPLGPKTLCNACGVRYKSGRLLPEYRPACSPTFSGEVHSNSHRKVLEMRRRKEGPEADSGLS